MKPRNGAECFLVGQLIVVCLMSSCSSGDADGRERHFTDKDVCKPFLFGICINELFVNTVSDTGYTYSCASVTIIHLLCVYVSDHVNSKNSTSDFY